MDHCGDDSAQPQENETVPLEIMSSSPEIINVQSTNAQIQASVETTVHSQPGSYAAGEAVYTQNIIYQETTANQNAQPATNHQTLQNLQPTSPVQVQVQVQQQSITCKGPQPNTSPHNPQKPQVRPDPLINDASPIHQIQQPSFPPNHHKPQISQSAPNNTQTTHQYSQPTSPSYRPPTHPSSQNNTPTSYNPPQSAASVQSPYVSQSAVSSQNPQNPQLPPPPQQNAPTAYQNSQPTASNQATTNPQSAPFSPDPTYSQAHSYQQSSTTYQDPTYNQANAYQQSTSTYQDPTYNQANAYQQYQDPTSNQNNAQQDSSTYQDPSLATSSQSHENPQSILQPEYSYPQDTTSQLPSIYQDPQAVANYQIPQDPQLSSTQEFSNSQINACYEPQQGAPYQVPQSCPPDTSNQEYVYPPDDAPQATTHQDSHEASFSQTSQNSQLVDEHAYNNEQSNEYADANIDFPSAPTTTYYDQNPDNGDLSMLTSGTNQVQGGDDMPDSGFALGDLGAAFGDIGLEGYEGGGDGVASLVENDVSLAMLNSGARVAQSTANAISGINPSALVNTGIGLANSAFNAVSSADPVSAVQAGLGIAMSSVRIAASIGTWNEARQRRKESAARFAATHGPSNPVINSKVAIATQIDEILLVLSALGQRLVVLEVINLAELPQALVACRTACAQADTGDLLAHFDTLDGTLQYAVTSAFFFCAACFPMHIYRGFGTGVLDNFLWGCPVPQFAIGQVAGFKSVDRTIAFLKSTPLEVQLLTRLPTGLNRIVPTYEKTERNERRRLMTAYKESVKELETKGHPQPRDGSFRVVSWHFPFATWNSPYTFKNAGHSFDDCLRWQMDAGRLLHAWTIGGHLDLMHGELMWLPAGVAETLARWLLGLPGMKFKLVPSSAFDYSNLRLKAAVRKIMFEEGFETVKAVRDPQADLCNPLIPKNMFVPAPPSVRRRPIAPVSHQILNDSATSPLSPRSIADDALSAERGAATNPSRVNQQIIHHQLGHQVDNQQPIARQDPRDISSHFVPLASQGPISPRDPQLPHLVSRPGPLPHQSPPQPMYQNFAVNNPVAPSTVAPSAGSQLMNLHPNQTHSFLTTNISDPSRNGQQTSPYATALPQHPSSSQAPVSTMQGLSLQANQHLTQNPPTTKNNRVSNSQNPSSYTHNPISASSQIASSNQFPQIHHQSTPTLPSQANTSPIGPHQVLSNQTPQFHPPTSSVSTVSSDHSSSSRISITPNSHPNSPDASSAFSAPNAVPTPYPFKVQSQGTIKRRPVPQPPTQLRRVKAIHDFIPEQENELGFKVGDALDVLNDSSQD
ncbi:hypothetical protein MMC31_003848, partial [Peltigera leucophlebia]|nr:hypothetical protein [Peltigera leucophlebia]